MKVERFQLSRKKIADFLLSFTDEEESRSIRGKAWFTHEENTIVLPEMIEKVIKNSQRGQIGFSINEIVTLGNHIEFTNLSSAAVQNWVKRDVRELIGSPQHGKKYTAEQAAILFIVKDLKASLDFESIRKILSLIFNNPADRSDDIIDPVHFYAAYASIFEKLHHEQILLNNEKIHIHKEVEQFIYKEAQLQMETFNTLRKEEVEIVQNMIITAVNTVIAAYYQHITKQNLTTTLKL
jgi:RNase P protein component